MSARNDVMPGALLHNLKHNKVLHERVIICNVVVEDQPLVPPEKRLEVEKLGKGFYSVRIHHGFFETPDVPRALSEARSFGIVVDVETATFFIGHETLVPRRASRARALAHLALHAACVQCAVAGAFLSPAAQPRRRARHPGDDLMTGFVASTFLCHARAGGHPESLTPAVDSRLRGNDSRDVATAR
ncbi:MAG: KUP/HAK/KT family potassium transporter [Rhizomicrobium sp.]